MRKEMNVKKVKCIYFGVIYSMIVLCLSLTKCMVLAGGTDGAATPFPTA